MLKVIKRISRILALMVVYIFCAYNYLIAKGFIFEGKTFILSNPAQAEELSFFKKINGDINIPESLLRTSGQKTAPLTMYVISSMSCAHCRDFHNYTLPKIRRDFVNPGKLRLVFIHFPLEEKSMRAAKLSFCISENRFDDFIDELFNEKDWLFAEDDEKLYAYAKKYQISDEDINKCNENKKITSDILLVRNTLMNDFKIQGTPSFIIEGEDGKELIMGAKSYDSLKNYLENRLKGE